jgi:hypothetical protein
MVVCVYLPSYCKKHKEEADGPGQPRQKARLYIKKNQIKGD